MEKTSRRRMLGRHQSCARKSSRSQEIKTRSSHESTNFNGGDETIHDRTGKPVVGRGASHEPGNDQAMLNEVDTDFRIPGLPHSVVKQAQTSRVRELVKKIENHPHRHALQRDLQQKSLQTVQCGVKANGSGRGQRRLV